MEIRAERVFFEMKQGVALVFAVFALIFLSSAVDAKEESVYDRVIRTGTIRCGYFTWPPYMLKDPNSGAFSGINYDFMMEIGRILDLKIEWAEEVSAGTALTGLEANRYDVMCASLWPDAARLKHSAVTIPEFYSSVYVVARKDDDRFDHGKLAVNDPSITIVGMEGDITHSLATQKYPAAKILALPQMSDSGLLMQSVASKKADLVLVDPGTIADFNKTNGEILKVVPGLPPVQIFSEVLAVKPEELQLKALLDSALRIVIDSGTAQDFVEKYPAYGYYAPRPHWDQSGD